ncbi:hypothetical protein THMIRHAS_16080 [Thiosulfatimonas sediminis]|uniref:TMEM205-like domain-containing protein n=1 Tax=Thiosulfatimonas sediminis TaxID=2675054 RepID=A0A6F8PVT6_9GAMM|nr:hypothetical protein THMIRHAS_16080 [Thiosulfatimonas sediminis]
MQATLGYLVTPLLFAKLDSKTAGDLAAFLFAFFSYVVMFFALLSLLILYGASSVGRSLARWPVWLVLLFTAFAHFVLGSWMAEIKAHYPQGLDKQAAEWVLFMQIHGIYQLLYLVVFIVLIGWAWRLMQNDK